MIHLLHEFTLYFDGLHHLVITQWFTQLVVNVFVGIYHVNNVLNTFFYNLSHRLGVIQDRLLLEKSYFIFLIESDLALKVCIQSGDNL